MEGLQANKKILKKYLHFLKIPYIIASAVALIAVKREVAAYVAGFPWSECQVRKLATSHCITNMVYRGRNNVCKAYDTHGEVYSHRLSY